MKGGRGCERREVNKSQQHVVTLRASYQTTLGTSAPNGHTSDHTKLNIGAPTQKMLPLHSPDAYEGGPN